MFDSIITLPEFNACRNKLNYIVQQLKPTASDIVNISNITIEQRSDPLWFQYRKMRLTASNFGIVLKAIERNRYTETLFRQLMGQYSIASLAAIQWGIDHESTAVADYEMKQQCKVKSVGLFLSDCGLLGSSPDGFVSDDCILEVKCPWYLRSNTTTIFEAALHKPDFYLNVI